MKFRRTAAISFLIFLGALIAALLFSPGLWPKVIFAGFAVAALIALYIDYDAWEYNQNKKKRNDVTCGKSHRI